jgi:methylenetetrahydrofolate dehydrogenase (NADP+)/methenyltetrahydrofolate cyclohydrolase
MIIDGKQMSDVVLARLAGERAQFGPLTLGVVMNEGDAASESFVKIKARVAERLGIEVRRYTPEHIDEALSCDGTIVQLPIPNADMLLAQLPREKDVDALGPNPLVRAPVAEAVSEILVQSGVAALGKKAVVVGEGRLVGKPVAALLRELGAQVTVVTLEEGSLDELRDADIVVCGAGVPGLVTPTMLKPGVVLIDAGTSESGGRLAGDADPRCAEVASVFTPVPGGVGPIAVTMLYKNLLTLAQKAHRQ